MPDWKVAKQEEMAAVGKEAGNLWMRRYFLPFEWIFLLRNPF